MTKKQEKAIQENLDRIINNKSNKAKIEELLHTILKRTENA